MVWANSADEDQTAPHPPHLNLQCLNFQHNMSLVVRKLAFCKCQNKNADPLRSNCAADQRLCFRYTDSMIPLLPKSEISSFKPSSVAVQPGLCQTWSEDRFSHNKAHMV